MLRTPSRPLVIQTLTEAKELLTKLKGLPGPFGFDIETHGCNPAKESPVGRGETVCWSLGWQDGAGFERAFLWRDSFELFSDWLGRVPLVVHNGISYDRHIVANDGFALGNIVCDTLRLSRLLRASKDTDHSLKGLMAIVGLRPVGEYRDLFQRRVCLGVEQVEIKDCKRKVDGRMVPTVIGPHSRLGAATELIDLRTIREYEWLLPTLYDYASLDAAATLEIYYKLRAAAEKTTWRGLGGQQWGNLWTFYEQFWNPFLDLLWDMERAGIQLDPALCDERGLEASEKAAERLDAIRVAVNDHEFNPGSPPQMVALLERLGCPPSPVCGTLKAVKKTARGKTPTDEAALDWLSKQGYHPVLREILAWRKVTKLGQFLTKLPLHCDGANRLHSILAPDTDTGRLSSKKPNLQNIPKEDAFGIRRAFVARPGHLLVCADFAQLEMVVLAHFLVELFDDWRLADDLASGDSHSATARRCWPWLPLGNLKGHSDPRVSKKREDAKTVNYAVNYGKTAFGLGVQITDESGLAIGTDAAQTILDLYFDAYPAIGKFRRHCFEMAKHTGVVRTLLGRTRPLLECRSDERWVQQAGERKAVNSPIQGSAADVVVAAMLKLRSQLPVFRARMVLQIHDEIIVETPEESAEEVLQTMVQTMTNPFKTNLLRVPLAVEAKIGPNWAACK